MAFYCILNGCLPAVWVATAPGISWYWVGLGMFLGSKGSPGSSKIQGTGLVAVWLPLRQAHLVVIAKRPQKSQEATRLLQIFWKFLDTCDVHWGWYSASNYEIEGSWRGQMTNDSMWRDSLRSFTLSRPLLNQSISQPCRFSLFLFFTWILLEFAGSDCIVATGYVDDCQCIRLAVWGGKKIVWMKFGALLLKKRSNDMSKLGSFFKSLLWILWSPNILENFGRKLLRKLVPCKHDCRGAFGSGNMSLKWIAAEFPLRLKTSGGFHTDLMKPSSQFFFVLFRFCVCFITGLCTQLNHTFDGWNGTVLQISRSYNVTIFNGL